MKLIDADKLREQIQVEIDSYPYECDDQAVYRYCQYLIDEAPDLSVKEDVDLEKEIDLDGEITKYWKDISSIYGAVGKEITRFDFDDVCRYFYELGKNGK